MANKVSAILGLLKTKVSQPVTEINPNLGLAGKRVNKNQIKL